MLERSWYEEADCSKVWGRSPLSFSLINLSAHPCVPVFMAVLAEPFKVGSANVMSGWCIRWAIVFMKFPEYLHVCNKISILCVHVLSQYSQISLCYRFFPYRYNKPNQSNVWGPTILHLPSILYPHSALNINAVVKGRNSRWYFSNHSHGSFYKVIWKYLSPFFWNSLP